MDIEKSAEELMGMELDQAVVRMKWPDAFSSQAEIGRPTWAIFVSDEGHVRRVAELATEPEAWANAADKVIEAEYEFRTDNTVYRPWLYCRKNHEDMWVVWFATRPLALEAAKRDYVQRNTRPAAPAQGDGEARPLDVVTIRMVCEGEITHGKSNERHWAHATVLRLLNELAAAQERISELVSELEKPIAERIKRIEGCNSLPIIPL